MIKIFKKMVISNRKGLLEVCLSISLAIFVCYILIIFSCDSNLKKIDSFNSNSILVSLLNIIINPTISFAIISISFIQIIYALSFYEKNHLKEYGLFKVYGVPVSKIIIFKLIQFTFMLTISLLISLVLIFMLSSGIQLYIYSLLNINGNANWISTEAFYQTISILLVIVAVAILVDIYIYIKKDTVEMLKKVNVSTKETNHMEFKIIINIVIFCVGLFYTIFKSKLSFEIVEMDIVSIYGLYGLVIYTIPKIIQYYLQRENISIKKYIVTTNLRERFQKEKILIIFRYVIVNIMPLLIILSRQFHKIYIQIILAFYLLGVSVNFVTIIKFKQDSKVRDNRIRIWKNYGIEKKQINIMMIEEILLFYFFSDLIISPYVFVNISIIYLNKDTLNSFFLYIVIYFLNNLIAIILLLNIERKNIDGAINNIK